MSKIFTLAVGAAGYVLGARAGRERYEQIKSQADKVWSNPKVQQAASNAQDLAADKAPLVKDKATSAAHKASSSAKDVASKASSKTSRSKTPTDQPSDDVVVDLSEFSATTPDHLTHG
jgi:hypothetical protein